MRFLRTNRFLLLGAFFISIFIILKSGSVRDGLFNQFYTVGGQFVKLRDSNPYHFYVNCFGLEGKGKLLFKLDEIGQELIEDRFRQLEEGEKITFAVKEDDWSSITYKPKQTHIYTVFSLELEEDVIFSLTEYKDRKVEANKRYLVMLYLRLLAILIVVDILRRNREVIVEKIEYLTDRVDQVIDPTASYPQEVKEYLNRLNSLGLRDRIRLTEENPRFGKKSVEKDYKIKTNKVAVAIFTGIQLSALAISSFFFEFNSKVLIAICMLLVVDIIIVLSAFANNKIYLVINKFGVSTPKEGKILWDDIEYTFLMYGEKNYLLIKRHGLIEPVKIQINGLALSAKKIGHIIEKLKKISCPQPSMAE